MLRRAFKVVSIRGTHGSGKSTIVAELLKRYGAVPLNANPKGRAEGYRLTLPSGEPLYVVGSYHTACGGCDGIQPYADIWPRAEAYLRNGHVLLEGALVSSSYGSVGHAMNAYAPSAYFAFLDTPLSMCLERIRQRREARWFALGKPGSPPPLNPRNTTVKFENVVRTRVQVKKLGSAVQCVTLRHQHAVKDLLALYGVKVRR